jgi:putative SbcD/Mre11-related phosphoesterase
MRASGTLIVADLHLGYGWAQRRKGELGPLADARTVNKLQAVCEELAPTKIVFLGDVVHAPRPCEEERRYIDDVLAAFSKRAALFSVQGNHDRAFAREFPHLPVEVVQRWSEDEVVALHGDKLPAEAPASRTLLMGHLHPSMSVKDVAGAGRRMPVFISTNQAIVLPAFSPFAHGYNLCEGVPEDFLRLMGEGPVVAHVASGKRVVAIGPLQSALQRMYQADVSAPLQFRRWR